MARGERKSRDSLDPLSRLFLDLREREGLKQPEAAEAAGITQSMLSRIETGRKVPDVATTRTLAALYHATPDERTRLIDLTSTLADQRLDSRLVMQRGKNLHFQQRVHEIEQSSALVRSYQPGMILGMLQTAAYAHAVFTAPRPSRPARSDSPEELTATRTSRYRQLADDGKRFWTLIQTEGALDWHAGSPEVMAEQLDQLAEAAALPHVRLGIIPARTRSRVFASHGFHLYDSRAVHIGTRTATALSTDRRDVEDYEALFGELEQLAVFGEEAAAIAGRIADEYRNL